MTVAREGLAADPVVEPPRSLRPILRFRRLSTSALESVRRALDEDAAFRARVAAAAAAGDGSGSTSASVGEAGRLFLERPEGWEAVLVSLEAAASAAADAASEEASERSARRRLEAVSERAQRAEGAVVALRSDVAAARTALAEEQRARRDAESALAGARARLAGVEQERDAAHRRAAGLSKEVARLEAALADRPAVERPAAVEPPSPASPPRQGPLPIAPPAPVERARVGPSSPAVDLEAVRQAVADAAGAASALGAALTSAAAALAPADASPASSARPPSSPRPVRAAPPVRLPVPLPPGLYDDDPAAADHLVRVAGCVLVVDGYNASLRRWPDQPIAEQRRRLVDALSGVAARSGADVQVVFDGADDQATSTSLARRAVRVLFSPAGVEADAVILDLVDRLPLARPVVVATDDRRVQRGAAARGANVVTQQQLFSLL